MTGARTRRAGSRAVTPVKKRTWSLPLPVAPWATASAFSAWAISTMRWAISGRESGAATRYLFS